jgi:hypothetical protein
VDEGFQQAPEFLHYLLNRDISHFNPAAPPPMSEAKLNIINWSRSSVEQEIEAMMEEGAFPFTRDLVSTTEVRAEIASRHKGRLSTLNEVANAMKLLGAVQLGQLRLGKAERPRPWAWRNVDQWRQATSDEIRRVFLMVA